MVLKKSKTGQWIVGFFLFTEGYLFLPVNSLQKVIQFITRTVRSSYYVRLLPLPITYTVSSYIVNPWRVIITIILSTTNPIERDAYFFLRE